MCERLYNALRYNVVRFLVLFMDSTACANGFRRQTAHSGLDHLRAQDLGGTTDSLLGLTDDDVAEATYARPRTDAAAVGTAPGANGAR
jgi:hypothetical protein